MNVWFRAVALSAITLFLFGGIAIGVDIWQFRSASEAGTAEIISLRRSSSSFEDMNGRYKTIVSYYPTIRFATSQGVYFEAETTESLPEPMPKIGDRVSIRYIIGSKGDVRLDRGALRDWMVAGSITAVSLIFLLITLITTRREVPEI